VATPQQPDSQPKEPVYKTIWKNKTARVITAFSIAALAGLWHISSHDEETKKYESSFSPYNQFVDLVKARKILEVKEIETGQGEYVLVGSSDGKVIRAKKPSNENFYQETKDTGVTLRAVPRKEVAPLIGFFTQWWPMLLLIGVWIYFQRRNEKQMQQQMKNMGVGTGANGSTHGMAKSKATLLSDGNIPNVKFADVAGIDQVKTEVMEIVEFLKNPEKFRNMGARIPRGMLLEGGPGLGKTLLAKAIAGEARVPFFTISGSAFVEMFVGVGAARMRDLFAEAKKQGRCIIFIDEIDAVARARGSGHSNDEREATLNQMLVEMDGFETSSEVVIIGATNRADIMDPAVLRPGRFDRRATLQPPDVKGRTEILQVHARKMNKLAGRRVFGQSIDFKNIAKAVRGFSGADLSNLLNEAAILAVRRNAKFIHMIDVLEAKDKIQMGFKREGLVKDKRELDKTACHEAGHALCAYLQAKILKGKVDKITIIPRTKSLGHTSFLPEDDQFGYTEEQLKAYLVYFFGGRMAEMIHFNNEKSTGARNDLERITSMARDIVMQNGMVADGDEDLPPRNYMPDQSRVVSASTMSEWQAQKVDKAINKIIREAEENARGMIIEHAEEFKLLWDGVKEFETLEEEDVDILMKDKSMDRLRALRQAREQAMNESVASEMADEPLTASEDDPPPGAREPNPWKMVPK
jgi:cell division protease FtsH